MPQFTKLTPVLATTLALCLTALPALADSTSSASSAASTSLGSSSTSIEKSSTSSSAKDKVAQGHYTIVAMAALEQQPDMLRVQLRAVAAAPVTGSTQPAGTAPDATPDVFLLLPRVTAERGQLAVGHTIAAEHRPYGVAFATVGAASGHTSAFFLVLDDAWFRELDSRPLGV